LLIYYTKNSSFLQQFYLKRHGKRGNPGSNQMPGSNGEVLADKRLFTTKMDPAATSRGPKFGFEVAAIFVF
jgi:hypothetical protein